ncbi:MAG: TerS protein [Chloroflexi bacterium]|nr:MAG: TerS protein [Chloroflexota bacterium]
MAKVDTVKGQIETFNAASCDIDPPKHVKLRETDLPFWYSVVRARAKNSWTDHDLEIAANLARCKADIERIQAELNEEGDTILNARGTVVMNPKHSLLETLSRRSVALSRIVQVHAGATVQAADQRKKNTAERNARQALNDLDDELIATPH